jgi:hypothetical protein
MEFYFGGPSSNAWNDTSRFESYVSSMEQSFRTKRYLAPIIAAATLAIGLLALAVL